jgi:hypothetical protein
LRNRLRLNRIDATIAVCLFAIGRVQKHSSQSKFSCRASSTYPRPIAAANPYIAQPISERLHPIIKILALPVHAPALVAQVEALPVHAPALVAQVEALPVHALALVAQVEALPAHALALVAQVEALPVHAPALVAQVEELPAHALALVAQVEKLPFDLLPGAIPRAPPPANPTANPPAPPASYFRIIKLWVALKPSSK